MVLFFSLSSFPVARTHTHNTHTKKKRLRGAVGAPLLTHFVFCSLERVGPVLVWRTPCVSDTAKIKIKKKKKMQANEEGEKKKKIIILIHERLENPRAIFSSRSTDMWTLTNETKNCRKKKKKKEKAGVHHTSWLKEGGGVVYECVYVFMGGRKQARKQQRQHQQQQKKKKTQTSKTG